MKKEQLEKELIKAWTPLFNAYPELKAIPVYAWGRYHKYESAGNPFESFTDDGFSGFQYNEIRNVKFQWDLLQTIDETHNIEGGEIYDATWGDYLPIREDVVSIYKFDERYGKCLVIHRNDKNELYVNVHDCYSRE